MYKINTIKNYKSLLIIWNNLCKKRFNTIVELKTKFDNSWVIRQILSIQYLSLIGPVVFASLNDKQIDTMSFLLI